MYDTYSDRNFVVVSVNVDADRRRVEPFLKQFNISLPVYFASPEDAGPLTATGIPSTFIIASRSDARRPGGGLLAPMGRALEKGGRKVLEVAEVIRAPATGVGTNREARP